MIQNVPILSECIFILLCVILLTIFAFFNLSIDLVSTFLISNFLSYYPIIIKLFRTKKQVAVSFISLSFFIYNQN